VKGKKIGQIVDIGAAGVTIHGQGGFIEAIKAFKNRFGGGIVTNKGHEQWRAAWEIVKATPKDGILTTNA